MTEKQAEPKKREWPLKLLALVCAVMLWFYAEAEKNPLMDMQFDVPVQYINLDEDYVVDSTVQSVRVTVKGKEVELSGLRSDDFEAVVDLSDAESGMADYKIEVTSSATVDRFSYQPVKAALQIDRIAKKEVPVRVRTTGTAPDNVTISSTEVQPNTVIITGLESQLEELADIETEAIDISTLSGDMTVDAALHLPDGVTVQGDAKVKVHFAMEAEERHVNTVIELRHVPEGMRAELSRTSADVTLSGSVELLDNSQELKRLKLYVDCSNLAAGQHVLPVQSEYTGNLTVESCRPQTVTVTITTKQLEDGPEQNEAGQENSESVENEQ